MPLLKRKSATSKPKVGAKGGAGRLPRPRESLFCSFCRKPAIEVEKLIAGPGVYICDGCVELCRRILAGKPIPQFPGFESLEDEALLKTLHASNLVVEDVREVLQRHVDALRKRDVSWERIGAALSMSRQAAWERFS